MNSLVPWSARDWLLAHEEGPHVLSKWWSPVRLIRVQTRLCHVIKMAGLSNRLTSTDAECATIQGVSCSGYFRILPFCPPGCTAVRTKRITVINLNWILCRLYAARYEMSRGVETKLHSLRVRMGVLLLKKLISDISLFFSITLSAKWRLNFSPCLQQYLFVYAV